MMTFLAYLLGMLTYRIATKEPKDDLGTAIVFVFGVVLVFAEAALWAKAISDD